MTSENQTETPQYYIVNLSHLHREHRYVTFWRDNDSGYAWPLSWAGRYSESQVREHLDYYNSGGNIAVPCAVVDAMAVDPRPGDIDNNAGPVVLSNRTNWGVLQKHQIAPPPYPMVPVYPGARGKAILAYSAGKLPPRKKGPQKAAQASACPA